MAPGLGLLRPAVDVGVVIAGDDGREGKGGWVYLGEAELFHEAQSIRGMMPRCHMASYCGFCSWNSW